MFASRSLETRLFVRYAQAMSAAQLLELALTSASLQVGVLSEISKQNWVGLPSFIEGRGLDKRTLGRVAKDLSDSAKVGGTQGVADLYRKLQNLIQKRNWLAHSFFNQNRERLTSKQGVRESITELESFREDCIVMTQVFLLSQNDSLLFIAKSFSELQHDQEQREIELWHSLLELFRTKGT